MSSERIKCKNKILAHFKLQKYSCDTYILTLVKLLNINFAAKKNIVKSFLKQNRKLRIQSEKLIETSVVAEITKTSLKMANRQLVENKKLQRDKGFANRIPVPIPVNPMSQGIIQTLPPSSSTSTSSTPPALPSPTGKWEFAPHHYRRW